MPKTTTTLPDGALRLIRPPRRSIDFMRKNAFHFSGFSLGSFYRDDGRCFGNDDFLSRKINKDPLQTETQIVTFFFRTPNDSGKVEIVMTRTFTANGQTYSNKNQPLTINTLDLDSSPWKRGSSNLLPQRSERSKIAYYPQRLRQ
ncbi:hypothetical protein [Kosakonia pseudosacchari]|uniref:hypothetical protein n=1 Tax=Kosakonia pseudosacchari TaxID=1646340 RepID=UPI00117ACBD9|nr:hypothetical protein [Kosakonia pseudosacchari]